MPKPLVFLWVVARRSLKARSMWGLCIRAGCRFVGCGWVAADSLDAQRCFDVLNAGGDTGAIVGGYVINGC